MRITKRQLRRIIKEENQGMIRAEAGAQDLMLEISALVDKFGTLNEALTHGPDVGPTWAQEITSASSDLRNRVIETIQDVQDQLDDGQYTR